MGNILSSATHLAGTVLNATVDFHIKYSVAHGFELCLDVTETKVPTGTDIVLTGYDSQGKLRAEIMGVKHVCVDDHLHLMKTMEIGSLFE